MLTSADQYVRSPARFELRDCRYRSGACDTCRRRTVFALWLALTCCTPVSSRFRNVFDGSTLLSEVANSTRRLVAQFARTGETPVAPLNVDLQNGAVDADQPSSFWTCKGNRPVAGDAGQGEPCASFIGSPSRSSRIGPDTHGAAR